MTPRYPFKPFPGSSHRWAIDEAAALPGGPLRILDVGAGAGHVARAIRAARPDGVEVWAVEPRPPAGLDDVADRRLAAVEAVEADGFDLALALDVIEHVPAPARLLAEVRRRLRPGGIALVSVPNVAHWSVRASLAAGRFDYAERGILDRTHLRFFTRRSLVAALEEAGLAPESLGAAIAPLELLVPTAVATTRGWSALTSLRRGLAAACPGLLAYQLLVRARPRCGIV